MNTDPLDMPETGRGWQHSADGMLDKLQLGGVDTGEELEDGEEGRLFF